MATAIKEDYYVLNPACRIRNDGKYVFAGFPSDISVSVLRLAPMEGIMAALMNGERSMDEATGFFEAMAAPTSTDPQQDAKTMVRYLVKRHLEPLGDMPGPLLVPRSELTDEQLRSLPQHDPVDFIVKPEDYNPIDLKLSYPASILWLITNECAVSCQYCYMDKTKIEKNNLVPFERMREVLTEARGKGLICVSLSGGDPFCHPRIFDLLELMEELGYAKTSIATKHYMSRGMAERLAACGILDELQFSIDSTVPEIADFLVRTPGFCERTIESIRNVQNAGIEKVAVKGVITPYNLPTLPKMYRDMKALGIPTVRMATYGRSGYNHKDKLFNHPDDYKWLDAEFEKLREEFPGEMISYQNGSPQLEPIGDEQKQKNWESRSRCTAGRTSITIAPNGKVVACEQMPLREQDYLGDIKTQSLEEAWNSAALDEYLIHPPRERLKNTPCYDCSEEEFNHCQMYMGICVRDCCIQFGTRWYSPPNCPKTPREKYVRQL
ncbi:MAG TPA: radical SAM protein [Patescibacteria group bacterium]|nr:radical SAM protein [Patescibacteria group bacterium]